MDFALFYTFFSDLSQPVKFIGTILNLVALMTAPSGVFTLPEESLLVPTNQGPVSGTFVDPSVRQFLGIPYASADRWEAPTLPPLRSASFNASDFGNSCLQYLDPVTVTYLQLTGLENSTIFVPESEDCLTVNIWTPSISRKQNTAVLLWIHGGGFLSGTSRVPFYNGKNIVRDNEDIIVVSSNYRLNIFGFPTAQLFADTSKAQNLGLLDVDAAVQWVYDNIAGFGGDPERIVLFGQSAGGVAVDAYTLAHPQDTKVKGVIEQSGSLMDDLNTTVSEPTFDSWNAVANVVGCGDISDASQLTCMKQVPSRQLEDAVIATNARFSLIPDGITILADTAARLAAGEFLHVPLLAGTTRNEADIFVVGAELSGAEIIIPNLTEILADLQTQMLTCSAGATASSRLKANVPTWRYEYQGKVDMLGLTIVQLQTFTLGVFPDISTRPDIRAYHTSEIPILFGTMPSPSETEKTLSRLVQGAWVAFARDPTQGLLGLGWPAYLPDTNTLAQIGNPLNQTVLTFTQGRLLDFTCNSTLTLLSAAQQLSALLPAGPL
ncbi:hypothetical protein H2248_004495 [Termitomyces sp. 'cryptogamus']|nr:hypothetical protein H2248_004495 [Termitomyces sp. 'cryptogamus']